VTTASCRSDRTDPAGGFKVASPGPDDLPKTFNQAEARALLETHGWTKTKGGKHVIKMEKDGMRPITLPAHKRQQYSKDLTRRILRQAGLV
jgi:predicted RNA binding protein YcfA (HicA-like mRNA interferase family)